MQSTAHGGRLAAQLVLLLLVVATTAHAAATTSATTVATSPCTAWCTAARTACFTVEAAVHTTNATAETNAKGHRSTVMTATNKPVFDDGLRESKNQVCVCFIRGDMTGGGTGRCVAKQTAAASKGVVDNSQTSEREGIFAGWQPGGAGDCVVKVRLRELGVQARVERG